MEIFSEEFKIELSRQLEELTNVVKQNGAVAMSISEKEKFMDACMDNPDCGKKEKNKKFKKGDVVYWGEREGIVTDVYNEEHEASTIVCFEKTEEFIRWELPFTEDGRYIHGTSIVLSHFPYELKMKKIK